jgi:predicted enzyme related to lactoylglutathione lyase
VTRAAALQDEECGDEAVGAHAGTILKKYSLDEHFVGGRWPHAARTHHRHLFANDLPAARDWYPEVLGVEPYFEHRVDDAPAYLEFRIGDYQHELGLLGRRFQVGDAAAGTAGVVAYWHVDDVQAAFERLKALGATASEGRVERGPGFVTASVVDPSGTCSA